MTMLSWVRAHSAHYNALTIAFAFAGSVHCSSSGDSGPSAPGSGASSGAAGNGGDATSTAGSAGSGANNAGSGGAGGAAAETQGGDQSGAAGSGTAGNTDAAGNSGSGDASDTLGGDGAIADSALRDGGIMAPPDARNDVPQEAGNGQVVSLFDGKTLAGWLPSSGKGIDNAPSTWSVLNGVIHCNGMVRGTLVSAKDYGSFRLMLEVRQTNVTHYASVLIWGTRPPPNDAIGGLQFGTPNAHYWDYRLGHTGDVAKLWTQSKTTPSRTEWAQCELLANAKTGIARLACCTVTGTAPCKAKEVLKLDDPTAGKVGPIALQAHDNNSHDEYRNITIEENPAVDDLITTK